MVPRSKYVVAFLVTLGLACAPALATGETSAVGLASTLRPRIPLPKPTEVVKPPFDALLTVKFRDDLRVRARNGKLISAAGNPLTSVRGVSSRHALAFEPRIQLAQWNLELLRSRAAARSGTEQPDLAGMIVVRGDDRRLELAARELLALDAVEWVEFEKLAPEPPCTDLSPTTPSYFSNQGYHGPDPGIDMSYLWSLGARGQGIQVADCEYGFIAGTEDLCNVAKEPGQTISPSVATNGWDNHGTAVLGEMVGLDNGYGVTGLVPDAEASFFTEWSVEQGLRRVTAITNAIAGVDPGDVVVLEMQTTILGSNTYGPAELSNSVWTVTRMGTDAGVIVVGAAGNGNQNLDGSSYADYRDRGDSGAILVGAGTANTSHDKLSFSTYGSRVNLQGWGQSVFSLGYGTFAELGGDERQRYTSGFSGTSSATPIVASAAVGLQSLADQQLGCRLSPASMRQLLVDTGIPQGQGGQIGPLPDLRAAADTLLALGHCDYADTCGNDVREGLEDCDGNDDSFCPGLCDEDCACPPPGPTPGEAHDLRVLGIVGGQRIALTYQPGCATVGNALIWGPLDQVSSYGYQDQVCQIGNSGSFTSFSPGMGSYFYLVVGHDAIGREGSYGKDGPGQERPESLLDSGCPRTLDLSQSCD